jgi:hypothetical protein
LKPVEKETEVILKFPDVDALNPPVLTMDEVSFRYPNTERIIFSGVNLGANAESRICIVSSIAVNVFQLNPSTVYSRLEKTELVKPLFCKLSWA